MTRWQGRIPLFIGVTGHRNLEPSQRPAVERAVRDFLAELRRQLPATPLVVLSQLAEGADQLVAVAALELGCDSVCVLPLELGLYRGRFASEGARAEFERLLALGDVIVLPEVDRASEDRAAGYAAAGYYIARHTGLLVALWDGVAGETPGSTADVVRYRLATAPGSGGAGLLHLPVARAGCRVGDAEPAFELLPARPGRSAQSAQATLSELVQASDWQQAEQFNAEAVRLVARESVVVPAPFSTLAEPHLAEVALQYATASTLARAAQHQIWRRLVLLHVLTVLAALAFLQDFHPGRERVAVWCYIGLLAAVFAVKKRLQHTAEPKKRLNYRCLAESLRVALYWRIASVHSLAGPHAAALRLVGREDEALRWIGLAVLGIDGWLGAFVPDARLDGCAFAATHWIGQTGKTGDGSQLHYYRAAASRARRLAHLTQRISNVALAGGIATAMALALTPGALFSTAGPVLKTIMGLLPLVSSTATSVVDVSVETELARQYDSIASLLERAAERLGRAANELEQRQVLFEVGTAVLVEQRVWHTILDERVP